MPSSTAKLTPSRARTACLPVKVFSRPSASMEYCMVWRSCLPSRRAVGECGRPVTARAGAVGTCREPMPAGLASECILRAPHDSACAVGDGVPVPSGHGKRRPGYRTSSSPTRTGRRRKLSELAANGPVVLFFYPAAMTPGCTAESCHFRDMKAEFDAVGAQRVGISADQVEKQKRFSDKHSFDYPLLSDPDGAVATQFGVRRRFTKLSPDQAGHLRHRPRPPGDRGDPERGADERARRSRPRGAEVDLARLTGPTPDFRRDADRPSPPGLCGDGMLFPWTHGRRTGPREPGAGISGRMDQLAQAVAERVVSMVMDAIDIDALLERVDVDALVSRVDVDAVVGRVDVDGLIDRVDVEKIIERVDVEKIIERVDVKKIVDRIDIDALVEQTELGTIIARSTSGVASEVLDVIRAQGVGLDDFFARWVNRVLRRSQQSLPLGPPTLVTGSDTPPELTAGFPVMVEETDTRPVEGRQGHYAGAVSRLVAFAADAGASWGLFTLGAAAIDFTIQLVTGGQFSLTKHQLVSLAAITVWEFVYFAYQWALSGKTIGMAVLGIRVVRTDGSPIGWRQAVVRTVALPLSFLILGLGFLGILTNRDRHALHDRLAGTAVVYSWDARAARLRWLARQETSPTA